MTSKKISQIILALLYNEAINGEVISVSNALEAMLQIFKGQTID